MKKPIRKELLDELLAEYANPQDLIGRNGLLKRLIGHLVERALRAESTEQLGYEHNAAEGQGTGNSRNGTGKRTLRTGQGDGMSVCDIQAHLAEVYGTEVSHRPHLARD